MRIRAADQGRELGGPRARALLLHPAPGRKFTEHLGASAPAGKDARGLGRPGPPEEAQAANWPFFSNVYFPQSKNRNTKLLLKTAGAWFKVTLKDAKASAASKGGGPPAKRRIQAQAPLAVPDP